MHTYKNHRVHVYVLKTALHICIFGISKNVYQANIPWVHLVILSLHNDLVHLRIKSGLDVPLHSYSTTPPSIPHTQTHTHQSATFDYDMVYKVAKATSDEVRAKVTFSLF